MLSGSLDIGNSLVSDERGVSMLEFALILPLFVVLISGAIDISTRVNSKNIINAAARQAAITASSFTFEATNTCPLITEEIETSDICPETPEIEVITPEMEAQMTISEMVRIFSCNYLKDKGFEGNNWQVVTQIGHRGSDGTLFPIVQVQLIEQTADCLICYRRFSEMVSIDATATQGLEGCPSVRD